MDMDLWVDSNYWMPTSFLHRQNMYFFYVKLKFIFHFIISKNIIFCRMMSLSRKFVLRIEIDSHQVCLLKKNFFLNSTIRNVDFRLCGKPKQCDFSINCTFTPRLLEHFRLIHIFSCLFTYFWPREVPLTWS